MSSVRFMAATCTYVGGVGVQLQPASAAAVSVRNVADDRRRDGRLEVEATAAGTMQHGRRHLAALRAAVFSRETDDDARGGDRQTAGDGGRSAAAGRQEATDSRLDGRRAAPGGSDDDRNETDEAVSDITQLHDTSRLASPTCNTCRTSVHRLYY